MSAAAERYVLDANAFIQAKRRFYGFDFCPGYWRALIWHQKQGRLCSIEKVREELKKGGDDLWLWAEKQFGRAAFDSASGPEVTGAYGEMLAWVMAQPQFQDAAKAKYQDVADGWLAAYGKANNCAVVTLEEYDSAIRRNVPVPNVCRAFDVECITPFEMLRRLKVQLSWQPSS